MTIVAIDFGTSNTVVSVLELDTQASKTLRFAGVSRLFKVATSPEETQSIPVVPTLAFVKATGGLALGEQVRSQRLGLTQPDRLFKSFKRDLVADFQPPPRSLDGQLYSVEFIAEQFLGYLWQQLQQQIEPSQVIFTVPVGAFERYRRWFQDAAIKLGIPEFQLVDEPTAAALGYAVSNPDSLVLVVDFGGGTLDLSLVRTSASVEAIDGVNARRAEVLAKADAYVGGEDIDLWIVEDYLQQVGLSKNAIGAIGWRQLLAIAERLKIHLSLAESATESWLDDETLTSHTLQLDRDRLEYILETHQFLEHLRRSLDDVLAIALSKGIHKSDIEQVLLVGGSCLIPAVQTLVISYFGRHRVKLNKPFEAIAHGALALSQLAHIDDYLHHSYAIRLWDTYTSTYSYVPLFDRGTQYPCQQPEPLILQAAKEGQHEIRLDIGEVAEVTQAEVIYDASGRMTSTSLYEQTRYRSLQSQDNPVCVARLHPPGHIDSDRILVQFEVTEQRMLVATVQDLLTNTILVERQAIAKLQ